MKFFAKIILVIVSFILVSNAYCQNDSINRQKYWHLRHRLITKFVKIGLGPGESVPANKYNVTMTWETYPLQTVKRLEWGDATTCLGWYIAVMATELEILQRNGRTDDIYYKNLVTELYYGLHAINRLDDVAEIIWGYAPADCNTPINQVEPVLWDKKNRCWLPKPGSNDQPLRNGFFVRNDGNEDILQYFPDANSVHTELVRPWVAHDSIITTTGHNKINMEKFGFYATDPRAKGFEYRANGYYPHNEASQDQIFALLLGLMLVNEFVEPEIKYDTISIKEMSKEIAL